MGVAIVFLLKRFKAFAPAVITDHSLNMGCSAMVSDIQQILFVPGRGHPGHRPHLGITDSACAKRREAVLTPAFVPVVFGNQFQQAESGGIGWRSESGVPSGTAFGTG